VLGNITAGDPIEAVEELETIDLTKVVDPDEHFLQRVRGAFMILDGINDGGLAIIQLTNIANAGDTVVALVDGGGATLRSSTAAKNTINLISPKDQLTAMEFRASRVEICASPITECVVCGGKAHSNRSFSGWACKQKHGANCLDKRLGKKRSHSNSDRNSPSVLADGPENPNIGLTPVSAASIRTRGPIP
jgi:repressor LexA